MHAKLDRRLPHLRPRFKRIRIRRASPPRTVLNGTTASRVLDMEFKGA